MDSNCKKTLALFRIWSHCRYPDSNLPEFIEQFEKEHDDFRAFMIRFIEKF